jgi:hypothetical protein
MPRVQFEPMIPGFEWVKTVHALVCAATVIDNFTINISGIKYNILLLLPFCSEKANEGKFCSFMRLKATAGTK